MAKKHTYSIINHVKICDQTGEVKAMKLGGIWFDLCGSSDEVAVFSGNYDSGIYEVYDRPSDTKVKIWHDWCKWARENNAQLRICSHSCMFFSINGTIIDADGSMYNLYITYANNRCTVIK